MMTAHERLAWNLRVARGAAKLSQTELAERIGVTHSTISGAENGKHQLSGMKLIRWARACGVSVDLDLAEGIE